MTVIIVVLVAVCAIAFVVHGVIIRRRCREARERIRQRPPCGHEQFVRELGLEPSSQLAKAALVIREIWAEYLGIAPEAITPETAFDRDRDLRPLTDSLDMLAIVFQIEARLRIRIPYELLSRIQGPFRGGNVGTMIHGLLDAIACLSKQTAL